MSTLLLLMGAYLAKIFGDLWLAPQEAEGLNVESTEPLDRPLTMDTTSMHDAELKASEGFRHTELSKRPLTQENHESCNPDQAAKSLRLEIEQGGSRNNPETAACMLGATSQNGDPHEGFDLLMRLPSNVVLKILKYLSVKDIVHRVSPVCKLWHEIAHDEALWCRIDMYRYFVSDETIVIMVSLCPFIKYIRLPDSRNASITDAGIVHIANNCPQLTALIASRSGSTFGDEGLIAMSEKCPQLQKMSLDSLEITNRALRSFATHLPKLSYLSLCQVSNITNEGVAELIRSCKSLKSLALNQNRQITHACFSGIPESSCLLERFELMMCSVRAAGVHTLQHLTRLDHLNLSECTDLTGRYLKPVVQNCRNIRLLSLNLNKLVDDSCIALIIDNIPDLNQIYLVSTAVTDRALTLLAERGRNLKRVDVGYTKVTGAGVRKISELCRTLQYLGLMRCDLVIEDDVEELALVYPHITYSTFVQDTKRLLQKAQAGITT